MFDHVTLRTADLAATARAYRPLLATLGAEPDCDADWLIEWQDFGFSPADAEHPVTTGVHVGLLAANAEAIAAFWQTGLANGLADDGPPGPRSHYGDGYVGGFLRDLDGNSIEACRHPSSVDGRLVDHVWLRVGDVAASRAFYAAVAEWTGFAPVVERPDYARFRGPGASFSVVAGEPVSAGLHMAFPADTDDAVHGFHAAALAAGGADHGGPGERPEYHPGYYGAFALDPDGHNVEVVNHHR